MLFRSLAPTASLVAWVGIAQAADVPNLVGTWKSTGEFAGARTVQARAGYGETPTFNNPKRPSIVIEKQEGRGFTGYTVLPDGSKNMCVGVLKRDGKQAILSCDTGKATIDIAADATEYCFLDDLAIANVASCDVIRKSRPN